jgi:hypothetical protein
MHVSLCRELRRTVAGETRMTWDGVTDHVGGAALASRSGGHRSSKRGWAGEIREHPTGPEHAECRVNPLHAQRQAYRSAGHPATGFKPSAIFKLAHCRR